MSASLAKHWINGEWISSARTGVSIDPATYREIGSYADGGLDEARLAIAAAKNAFSGSRWRDDKNFRADVIEQIAAKFDQYAPELIASLSLEIGKVGFEAGIEVNMCGAKLRYNGALARALKGESGIPRPGVVSMTVREAVGVVAVIVPWNAPVVLMVRSLAPALAAGNSVVIKMPSQTAQTNALMAKLLSEVKDLPRGVINIFTESGGDGAKELVASPDTAVISYTGSTHVGSLIAAEAGRLLKRVSLELGGKSPHIVFNDADLNKVLPVLGLSVTIGAGQFCMAGSRLLVQEGIAGRVTAAVAARFNDIVLGAPADSQTQMGPMIDKANVARVERVVEQAIAQGASAIVRGGAVTEGPLAAGAFYRPTLLAVSDQRLDISQQETFGPVMTVQTFGTEAEALALANDSQFGLAASVWTSDMSRAFRLAGKLEAGTVWLNDWAKIHDEFEEGGVKKSGMGRLNGPTAIDDFLEIKHITFETGEGHGGH